MNGRKREYQFLLSFMVTASKDMQNLQTWTTSMCDSAEPCLKNATPTASKSIAISIIVSLQILWLRYITKTNSSQKKRKREIDMTAHDTDRLKQLFWAMIDYYEGDAARIQHFLKVYAIADLISKTERLDEDMRYCISVLALTHDIGIKESIKQYGRCNAQLQELLGPAVAKDMLNRLGFDCALIDRVCTVIGRHHTYSDIDGIDCRILIEADILANLQEGTQISAVPRFYYHVFQTVSGKSLLKKMYPNC